MIAFLADHLTRSPPPPPPFFAEVATKFCAKSRVRPTFDALARLVRNQSGGAVELTPDVYGQIVSVYGSDVMVLEPGSGKAVHWKRDVCVFGDGGGVYERLS